MIIRVKIHKSVLTPHSLQASHGVNQAYANAAAGARVDLPGINHGVG